MSSHAGRGLSDLYARVSSRSLEGDKLKEEGEDKNERIDRSDTRSERSARSERTDRSERNERSDRTERTDRVDRSDRTDRNEYRPSHSTDRKRQRSTSPVASERSGRRYDDRRSYRESESSHRDREGSHKESKESIYRDRDSREYRRDDRRDTRDSRDYHERERHRDRYPRNDSRNESRHDSRDDSRDNSRSGSRFDSRDNSRHESRFDSRDNYRNDQRKRFSSSNDQQQIPFDRFARLSPWNGPTCPLEERPRHLRNWDAPPPGFERVPADKAKSTGLFPPPGNITKVANYLPPVLDPARVAMLQMLTGNAQFVSTSAASNSTSSAATSTNPAILKQARRFYVGNLPNPVNEVQLSDFLERNLSGLAAAGTDAPRRVLSINVATDRSYAFVEVNSAEDATMAMNLDGVQFQGVQLKIRRPKEYHLAQTEEKESFTANATDSTELKLSEQKLVPRPLVLSEIPEFLTEAHIRALLGMLAELRQFILLKREGVAVFEFVEDEAGEEWSAPLLKETGGSIFVGPFEMRMKRLIELYSDSADETEEAERLRRILSCYNLQPGYATAPHSTPILQLLNVVDKDSLAADYEGILTDLRSEMQKYAADEVEIVMPAPDGDALVPGLGRVFVRFGSVEEAVKAAGEVAGRVFDGKTCIVSYFPLEKYEKRQF